MHLRHQRSLANLIAIGLRSVCPLLIGSYPEMPVISIGMGSENQMRRRGDWLRLVGSSDFAGGGDSSQ